MHVDDLRNLKRNIVKILKVILPLLSGIGATLALIRFGFGNHQTINDIIDYTIASLLVFFCFAYPLKIFLSKRIKEKINPFSVFSYLFLIALILPWGDIVGHDVPLIWLFDLHYIPAIAIIIIFLKEVSAQISMLMRLNFNPSIIFISTFILLIIVGALILNLPSASTHQISFVDALFTATSAICITGLTVLNTAQDFTFFGQVVIIILAQVGALGIMTFSTFFVFVFQGGASSFKDKIALKEMLSEDKLSEIFSTIVKIVFITLLIEFMGIVSIYFALLDMDSIPKDDVLFLSIFHGISAFCNTGFSTFNEGLMQEMVVNSYQFQITIMLLVIIGGLGFPIVFSYYKLIKYHIKGRINQLLFKKPFIYPNRILNLNSKLVIRTTIALLLFGFLFFLMAEWNNQFSEMSIGRKILHSFFTSVTCRNSGFNTIDFSLLNIHSILIVILLMWIGASPASTGGGIRSTTFALAILNLVSLFRGKDKIEFSGREISNSSVRKAFAVILLSFLFIGIGIMLVSIFEKDLYILHIVFECFSAYTTTGLSLGITHDLSDASKLTISTLMFIGRLGTFTILAALIKNVQTNNYQYPKEDVIIV
jgi:trk system potassium uptake protein TrkH